MNVMQERSAATSPSEPSSPFSLTLPFAILGFVGGWSSAAALGISEENVICWLLLGITPLVSAGLGRFLSPRLRSGPLTTGLRLLVSIMGAGVLNGALVGVFIEPPFGILLGFIFGAVCAVPFLPALGAVAFMARRIGRARPGSIVDQADRRAVFRVTLVVAAVASMLSPPPFPGHGSALGAVPFVVTGLLLILLALDVRAFVRVGSLKARVGAISAPAAERPDRAPDTSVTDFGLGDEEAEEIAQRGAVYRDHARTIHVFRGSASRARAELAWAIAANLLALSIAGGLLVTRAWQMLGA